LIGHDATDIEGLHARMDRLIFANNSIKSAFDIACHDIAAQAARLPLYRYLGGSENRTLITDYTVSLGTKEKMAADAQAIVHNGFQVIKVKLGGAPQEDIERVLRHTRSHRRGDPVAHRCQPRLVAGAGDTCAERPGRCEHPTL
jgi:L-alanine-DL-glutamate epimerase-like enolase superfamily enzyme